VRARLRDGSDVTGRVGASDDTGVTLDVAGQSRRMEYDAIATAHVQIEFNRKSEGP
jgi:ribosome maturation factor RimP